jgi:hypothetical protein
MPGIMAGSSRYFGEGGKGGGRDVGRDCIQYGVFLYSVWRCVSTSVLLNSLEYSSGAGVHLQKLIFPSIFLHSVYFAFLTFSPLTKKLFRILCYKCFGFAISSLSSQDVICGYFSM